MNERPCYRRAGACPPPCPGYDERSRGTGPRATVSGKMLRGSSDREGQALALRCRSGLPFTVGRGPVPRHARDDERSRGTGPRATVSGKMLRGSSDREGQALALRYAEWAPFHRRAGACPPPCPGCDERSRGTGPRATVVGKTLRGSSDREGQALALRYAERAPFHRRAGACPPPCPGCEERSRGTGPRATVGGNGNRKNARDRPSRYGFRESYGEKRPFFVTKT